MKYKKIELFEVLLWIVAIILFVMILTRIFGNSATDTQIYLGFFTSLLIIIGHIIKLNTNIGDINRELGEFKIKTINSFDNLKSDMELIKNKLKIK